jgi:hypothetical protein
MEIKMEIKDTSKDYEDLIGFKSKETIPVSLAEFLGEEIDTKPRIKPKPVDKEYPEDWQNLFVNFRSEEDYIQFMKKINKNPDPKTSVFVYTKDKQNSILDFMES